MYSPYKCREVSTVCSSFETKFRFFPNTRDKSAGCNPFLSIVCLIFLLYIFILLCIVTIIIIPCIIIFTLYRRDSIRHSCKFILSFYNSSTSVNTLNHCDTHKNMVDVFGKIMILDHRPG